MPAIRSLAYRKILNSHVELTNEFVVELDDGSVGNGASARGETISIYEDRTAPVDPETVIRTIKGDGYLGRTLQQEDFDSYLQQRISRFGRHNAYGLSLAFFNALSTSRSAGDLLGRPQAKLAPPRLCCNILNGGWHAYTNPVLSDWAEYLLVARSNDIASVIEGHNEIQRAVKERLAGRAKTVVGGNPVNRFATADNRECIEFLLGIRDSLGLSDEFDLMIDASAGDLLTAEGYRLAVTGGPAFSREAFCDYWLDIIRQYDLRFLEDPFAEEDIESWQRLTAAQRTCYVIGDNLYSSDASRIEAGAAAGYTHGAVIKPSQAGTVSAVCRAIEAAQRSGQVAITSHRSISTESVLLSTLTCLYGVGYIKIGPLMTDYSAVLRLNQIIRLTGGLTCP